MSEAISSFEALLSDYPSLTAVRENLELAREAERRGAGATSPAPQTSPDSSEPSVSPDVTTATTSSETEPMVVV